MSEYSTATCKGHKKDGTPCTSTIVLDNGYCRAHQYQAQEAEQTEEQAPWTRERLEAVITVHGGPQGLDLTGADLSNLDLSGMDLHGVILSQANLQGAILVDADLYDGELWGANLREANLVKARLDYTRLDGARLWSANLQEARLYCVNLTMAKLGHAKLHRADLWGANLQGTYLVGADLQEADLGNANLQEANGLQGANLRDANLQGANLQFADLREVDLLDVVGLRGIRLYRAKLDHTVLKREQLEPGIGEELAGEYREARDAYLALKQNFEDLGDYEAASWSYIKERQMEKLEALQQAKWAQQRRDWKGAISNYAKFANDEVVEWVCNYGEGIKHVIRSLILVWLFFALIYGLISGVGRSWQDTGSRGVLYIIQQLIDLLSFSLGAMTTLEAPGLEARPVFAMRILMPLEALLSIVLAGLLGFVLGNRIRRS